MTEEINRKVAEILTSNTSSEELEELNQAVKIKIGQPLRESIIEVLGEEYEEEADKIVNSYFEKISSDDE